MLWWICKIHNFTNWLLLSLSHWMPEGRRTRWGPASWPRSWSRRARRPAPTPRQQEDRGFDRVQWHWLKDVTCRLPPLEEQQGDQDYQRKRHSPEDPGHGQLKNWQQEKVWFWSFLNSWRGGGKFVGEPRLHRVCQTYCIQIAYHVWPEAWYMFHIASC